jgi:tol-pal system protein YbgF
MKYVVLIFLSFLIQNTYAEEYEDRRTLDRLNNMEKNLNILQQEFYRQDISSLGKSSGNAKGSPKLEVKINALEEQIRYLTGKVEEKDFLINNLSKKLDSLINDMNVRFAEIEKKHDNKLAVNDNNTNELNKQELNKQELGSAPIELGTNLEKTPDSIDTANDYEKAFEYMRQSNYQQADTYFRKFIENNKNSDLIGNAYFWIGQMFFLQNNYEQSAVNFLKGYQHNPKGNKASYNLMKLGMSLNKLNKKQEACTTYAKVTKEFPNAEGNIKDQIKAEQTSLGCS